MEGLIEELDVDSWRLDELLRPLGEWNPDKERIIENFMVIGVEGSSRIKSNTTSLPAEILYTYPAKSECGAAVIPYLFPDGKVSVDEIDKTQSLTDINSLLFWQTSSLQNGDHSFVFQIGRFTQMKGDVKKPLYIVGVMNRELLRDKLTLNNLVASPIVEPKSPRKFMQTEVEHAANRAYIFVTRTPYFKMHFEILFTILAREQMRRCCRRAKAKIPNGNELVELVQCYYNARIPDRLELYSLRIPGSDDLVKFTNYSEQQMFMHWSAPTTFQLLSVNNVLTIFEALLMEHSVLFVSPSPGTVTNIAYTFYRILDSVIGWNGIFEPLAPPAVVKSFPLKYIAGVTVTPLGFPEDTIVFHVESNRLIVPASIKLHGLPNSSDLELCIEKIHNSLKNSSKLKRIEPFKVTTEQQMAAKEVMDEFNKYLTNLKKSVFEPANGKKYDSALKHKDKVASSFPKLDREFYKDFMSTRNFEFMWKKEYGKDDKSSNTLGVPSKKPERRSSLSFSRK
eukprot:TRINITY_DN15036_c0_g1_i1.p1 TRINITY_DN15036_c0_g1~~TRINITY_DN15036_c0_g1_i1.p1  ORF type:complete len:509 (+),score=165.72 TRINITY_DN15036_c0_g1_i1:1783-3309(+)